GSFAKLGQSIDQRLGDAVTQVLRLRIAARVFEREDRQRIDRLLVFSRRRFFRALRGPGRGNRRGLLCPRGWRDEAARIRVALEALQIRASVRRMLVAQGAVSFESLV